MKIKYTLLLFISFIVIGCGPQIQVKVNGKSYQSYNEKVSSSKKVILPKKVISSQEQDNKVIKPSINIIYNSGKIIPTKSLLLNSKGKKTKVLLPSS